MVISRLWGGVLSVVTGVLKKRSEDEQRHREEGHVKRRAETGVMSLIKEHQAPPGKRQGRPFP